jgi:23S rRNA (uracil1939-C5)-methyltransferase
MGRKRKPKLVPEVTLTGIADKGRSVGRDAEGRVLFVEDAVPGDVADVLVYRKRKGYLLGKAKHFHRRSPDRTEPFCSHFGVCGGCKWQHLRYPAQLRHKQQQVEDAMQRIARVPVEEFRPILGAEHQQYYRNKLEFSFSNKRWLSREELNTDVSNEEPVLGFHPPGAFDKVVNIDHCYLQHGPSNELRNGIRSIALDQGLSFYDPRAREGFLRQLMLRTTTLGQSMALLSFGADDAEARQAFLRAVRDRFPGLTTILYCINTKWNDSMSDLDMHTWDGPGYVEEALGEVRFRIGPKSFFQTNTRQARRLYDVALDFAGLSGTENLYDLYTGIGSIALYAAGRCKQVVGIEEVEEAIADARTNAGLNGIANAVFYAGDVKDILSAGFARQHGRPDVLITDPPRAGMHADVVRLLLELEPPRIVYVSCNPATQARDIGLLAGKYRVTCMQPVDMFPHTHHVENVAALERK